MKLRAMLWVTIGTVSVLLAVHAQADSVPKGPPPKTPAASHVPAPFARFSHVKHDKVFQRVGWICLNCHAIGARQELVPPGTDAAEGDRKRKEALIPPPEVCHVCHEDQFAADAPTRCRLCHELDEVKKPESHRAGWVRLHGREAAARPAVCTDCHDDYTCVQCHVRREDLETLVHPGTWLTTHGMAARTDPTSCETCHEGDTCATCHTDPDGRQGW